MIFKAGEKAEYLTYLTFVNHEIETFAHFRISTQFVCYFYLLTLIFSVYIVILPTSNYLPNKTYSITRLSISFEINLNLARISSR